MERMAKTHENDMLKVFGANLSRFIAEAGLSETKLALIVGVSQASVNRWCKGEVAAGIDMVGMLAKALNRKPMDFFNVEPPPPQGSLSPALVVYRGDHEPTKEDLEDERVLNARLVARLTGKKPPKWP